MFLKIFFGHVSPFCQVRVVPCSVQKQHSEFSVIIQIYSLATWWMLHNWRFIQHQTCFEHWQIFKKKYLNKYSSAGEPCLHKELPPGQDTSCFFWMNSKNICAIIRYFDKFKKIPFIYPIIWNQKHIGGIFNLEKS